ncbi:hypothetical protein [Pseudomonas sp. MUP55]|uniref:hypothetical protein n=1 Tax=Pseudomonas sp. MUP55 TaxID=3087234 RepID=UPI002A5AB2DA|nr:MULTISPECIES: hypothetical protein [unclassified Pseudomonas]WPN93565.1 hypothetical protein SC319_04115 [Pseudomonas sp. MUP56]WPN99091.1 hypothetical protein SC318_04115 [Pseudomonas sp. MUP55]
MTKDELRQQLQEQFEQHLQANPDAVTLYAPESEPETKPWKKHGSLFARSFGRLGPRLATGQVVGLPALRYEANVHHSD